jgi:hypothetical protein
MSLHLNIKARPRITFFFSLLYNMGHGNALQLGRISLACQIIKQVYSKNALQLKSACKITVVSLVLYTAFRRLYDSYFGPLREIPGPFITRFMDLPSIIYDMPLGTL